MLWNKALSDVLSLTEDGVVHIDYTKFHHVEELPQWPYAARNCISTSRASLGRPAWVRRQRPGAARVSV